MCLLIMFTLSAACAACGWREAESQAEGENPFLGSWVSEEGEEDAMNLTLDIWIDSDGVYHGQISIPQDETTVDFLEFSAKMARQSLKYTDGKRTRISYDEENLAEEEVLSSDDAGEIRIEKNKLTWEDKREGKSVTFF